MSELLGSFGDNELSPECLDGAQTFLKSETLATVDTGGSRGVSVGVEHPPRQFVYLPACEIAPEKQRAMGQFRGLPLP